MKPLALPPTLAVVPKVAALTKVESEGFDDFWEIYPRKTARKAALKAWTKLNPAPDMVRTILDDLAKRSRSRAWTKDGGQFVPHASTYLNGERWNDAEDGNGQGRNRLGSSRIPIDEAALERNRERRAAQQAADQQGQSAEASDSD